MSVTLWRTPRTERDFSGTLLVTKEYAYWQYAGTKKGHRKVVALAGHPFAVAPNTYLI